MKNTVILPLLLLLGLLSRAQAEEEVTIKLATLAPVGSPWHVLLKEAAQTWSKLSGDKIKLKIFAGGTMGNEGDMVRKMRIGQIQAAALSTIGLHEISKEPLALDLPLMVQNQEERDYVLGKIAPKLEAALAREGYVILNWSEIGFVRFFTTKPRSTLAQMREGKIFTWDGDPDSAAAWKAGGFHPVVLSSTDIIPSLQTGIIDVVAYPPTYALAIRISDKAKYMSDLIWCTLTGSLVIKKETWDKIPANWQGEMLKVAQDLGKRTVDQARKMESDSLAKMKSQGLQVVHVTDVPEWRKVVEDTAKVVRGKVVPAETYDEVQRLAKEARAGKK